MAAALFVAFSLLPAGLTSVRAEGTGQGENAAPAAVSTKVSGLCTRLKRTSWTGTLKDSITVKPAYGREVRLYYYDSSARKWIRKKTYHTANQESAKVTLAYTPEWKTRYTTKWKITIPKKAAFTKTTGTDGSQNTGGQEGGSQAAPEIVPESRYYSKTITVTAGYLNASSAVVLDAATGRAVYSKNPTTKRKPASMTKMMTAILLAENKGWNDKVKITKEAAATPWGLYMKNGDVTTAKNILYAMMLPSANDAACAAGISVGGTTANFARMMTNRAKQLGAYSTVYKNAHGLDTVGNYSTAKDTAKIGAYLMQAKSTALVRKAITTTKYSFRTSKKKIKYTLYSTDAMLSDSEYEFAGIKTGTTTLGGCCFCGAFEYDGRQYISVIMGASNNTNRWSDTRKLADLTEYAVVNNLNEYVL